MKKKLSISILLIFCYLFINILYSCSKSANTERVLHLRIETTIKKMLDDNKYKDYRSIKYSPIYANTVIRENQATLKEILSRNISDREVEEYLDNYDNTNNLSLEQNEMIKVARDVLADKGLLISMNFILGGAIKPEIYKEIIYRNKIIRDNKLTPRDFIIFHKFSYKDKYNDSYTEYLGVLIDSTNCYLRDLNREVQLTFELE